MVPFPLVALLVFALYSRRSFRSTKGFYPPQEIYGGRLVFYLGGVFTCFMCTPFSPLMGRSFDHLFSPMFNFKESQWVQSCYHNSLAHDADYSFKGHHCPCANYTPPLDLVPPPIFDYYLKHIFVLDRTLFAQALTTSPHLFSSGFFGIL
jgi:hypothetical protein